MNTANRVFVRREAFAMHAIEVLIACINERGDLARGEPTVFRSITPEQEGHGVSAPTFQLSPDAAQQLIDELWRIGIRPTEGHGSTGQLAATERHLSDMRSLVFKTEPKP